MEYEVYDKEGNKLSNSLKESYSKSFLFRVVVNFVALMVADYLFKSLFIDNLVSVGIAALVLTIFNATVKPFLILITLPLTLITLGLFYPIVNVIVMYLVSWIMGSHFVLTSFFTAIGISLVIAIVNFAITHLFKKQ